MDMDHWVWGWVHAYGTRYVGGRRLPAWFHPNLARLRHVHVTAGVIHVSSVSTCRARCSLDHLRWGCRWCDWLGWVRRQCVFHEQGSDGGQGHCTVQASQYLDGVRWGSGG